MPAKAQSKIVIASSLIPLAAVLLGAIAWIFNLQATISNNQDEIQRITEQLAVSASLLAVNSRGESELELRFDQLYGDIDGINYFLYEMSEGPRKTSERTETRLAVIETEIAGIMSDHRWYAEYIAGLNITLRAAGIYVETPRDSYD